jgi:hypothetical protein
MMAVWVGGQRIQWFCDWIDQRSPGGYQDQRAKMSWVQTSRKILNLAIESTDLGKSSRVLQLSTNECFADLDENLRNDSGSYFLEVEIENKVVLRSSFRVDSRTGF